MKRIKKRYYFLAAFLLISVYIICNFFSIWSYADKDETQKADAAIVLGAAASGNSVSPVFRERINHAISLYQNGYVNKIIITGGVGEGNRYSDAYIGSLYATEQGIPEQDILVEEKSAITQENLENAAEIMAENDLETALIVSDPLHMKRSMLLARDIGITAYTSPTHTSMYKSLGVKLSFTARETFFYIGYKFVRFFL